MIARHDFKVMDATTFGMSYVIAVILAWLMAAVDWWKSRVWMTAIAGAAVGYAVAIAIGFPFIDPFASMMIGLVFGVAGCGVFGALGYQPSKARWLGLSGITVTPRSWGN